jgi:hypothetical protein
VKLDDRKYVLTDVDRSLLNEIQEARDWAAAIFEAIMADKKTWRYLNRTGTFAEEIELWLEDERCNQEVEWVFGPDSEPREP